MSNREDFQRAIDNMDTEGGYKELVLHLKHDAEFTYKRIKEIADSRELLQNPKFKKSFRRLLDDSRKNIVRLDKELIKLEKGDSGSSGKAKGRRNKGSLLNQAIQEERERSS